MDNLIEFLINNEFGLDHTDVDKDGTYTAWTKDNEEGFIMVKIYN